MTHYPPWLKLKQARAYSGLGRDTDASSGS